MCLDDVDTELLRLLANKTMHMTKQDKSKNKHNWTMQNGSAAWSSCCVCSLVIWFLVFKKSKKSGDLAMSSSDN